jgi:hypothetical protein
MALAVEHDKKTVYVAVAFCKPRLDSMELTAFDVCASCEWYMAL